jgi:hypothetical protein
MIEHTLARRICLLGPLLLSLFWLPACATRPDPDRLSRPFVFGADTPAFANELQSEYTVQPDGRVHTTRKTRAPKFSLRCFPMVRMVREFHHHAAFDPTLPKLSETEYRASIRQVIARNSLALSPPAERILFPGFANLHSLSEAHPTLLRNACGGAWRSYFQRGNWRMVLPFSRSGQSRTARVLDRALARGHLPILHVVDFPQLSLNHAVLIFGSRSDASGNRIFPAYDPNDSTRPIELRYDTASRQFHFPATAYFPGGNVNVYEVYRTPVR